MGADEAIARIISAVVKGPVVPVLGRGDALVAPVYVDDVIDGCVEALLRAYALGKSYTLAGPEEMTFSELIERIEKLVGKRRPRLHIPVALVRITAMLASLVGSNILVRDQIPRLFCIKSADITAARSDLDFTPRSLEQGFNDFRTQLRMTNDE